MYLIELLTKSLDGSITKEESEQLIPMLLSEIKNLQDRFDDGIYEVLVNNKTTNRTGIVSKTLEVICRKHNGVYVNLATKERYNNSDVISAKQINS